MIEYFLFGKNDDILDIRHIIKLKFNII